MQKFLTATELSISERERDVLIKVLGMMESGKIKNSPKKIGSFIHDLPQTSLDYFNMRYFNKTFECGTVGCILGWARYLAPRTFLFDTDYDESPSPLRVLFFEFPRDKTITVKIAAKALRNFLTTGQPQWGKKE
jgi:hypothetical protein